MPSRKTCADGGSRPSSQPFELHDTDHPDRALYKECNRIERVFGHLKINRAIATRYGQLAQSFLSMIQIATG